MAIYRNAQVDVMKSLSESYASYALRKIPVGYMYNGRVIVKKNYNLLSYQFNNNSNKDVYTSVLYYVFSIFPVCRALGIPCRTVTNFSSAHDTDESNSIEKYFQRNDGVLEKVRIAGSSDSVWQVHVYSQYTGLSLLNTSR